MRPLVLALVLGLLGLGAAAAAPRPHVEARLIAETETVTPGQTLTVALRQIIEPGWHLFWPNPGDAGQATTITWRLPPGFSAGPMAWPAPARIPVGTAMNFGYEREAILLVEIAVPAELRPGTEVSLEADAAWLVCEEICVPEHGTYTLTLPVGGAAGTKDPLWAADFARARQRLPQPLDGTAIYAADEKRFRLTLDLPPSTPSIGEAAFFPREPRLIRNAAPQTFALQGGRLTIATDAGRVFTENDPSGAGNPPDVLEGVVVLEGRGGGRLAYAVSAKHIAADSAPDAPLALPVAFLFAVLGGLILNLMPCVFPVLTLKATAVLTQAHPASARLQGLAYGAGVILSFLAVAGLLLLLRQAGASVGWGFHLQSPVVVAVLALLFVAIGLNLAGVFDVGFLQGVGPARMTPRASGAFLTGVLAVVVATPCTAPFMAAAVGAALSATAPVTLAIFAGLGIGLAAPFVVITFIPAIARLLPKPGRWMVRLKAVLAVPMLASAVWLGSVLVRQTGWGGVGVLGGASLALWFALSRFGRHQREAREGAPVGAVAGVVVAAGLTAALAVLPLAPLAPADRNGAGPRAEAYSPARLTALLDAGRPVFIDVTAAWCITCQLNEAAALSSSRVAAAFAAQGVAFLKADWTRADPDVTALLESYGRNGVPLYLYFRTGVRQGEVLPQILSEDLLLALIATPDPAKRP